MKKLTHITLPLLIVLFIGCGQDRAMPLDDESSKGVGGVSQVNDDGDTDTDGDGLSDEFETNHDLNLSNSDTDGDGLDDYYEVINENVDPKNPDTDSDGLSDGDEVLTYGTVPNNSDTDGDCLLDGFEVNHYETNVTNDDTDSDGVEDGIEIYGELNTTCLTQPETLEGGHNPSPAMDAVPDALHDVWDVFDPSNDSDGDSQANIKELNCTQGDPKDATKMCPFVTDSELGNILTEHGYSYVPGGFDVDGDGVNEGGFWISRYQARSSGVEIPSETVIEKVGNVNQFISENFHVLNKEVQVTSYKESPLSETTALAGTELVFDEESVAGLSRISSFTPYLAQVCLKAYRLLDKNGSVVEVPITMPTLKQYVHVKMLLDADLAHNGDGRHIRNGLLGTDQNVPLFDYNLIIDEFGEERKEYVRNLVQLRNTYGESTFDVNDVPEWWRVDKAKYKYFENGAHSTQDLGHGIGPDKDPYAVIVRGGEVLDVTEGVSGALTDDEGATNGISFRAATPYLY